jgi:hypothetical protein
MTRQQYIEMLRATQLPQCRLCLMIGDACCAMGLIGLELGIPEQHMREHDTDQYREAWHKIGTELDSMKIDVVALFRANDSGKSFAQIATMIEEGRL